MACKSCIVKIVTKIDKELDAEFIFWDVQQYLEGEREYPEDELNKFINIINEQCPECPKEKV
jgi:hypothetical protein